SGPQTGLRAGKGGSCRPRRRRPGGIGPPRRRISLWIKLLPDNDPDIAGEGLRPDLAFARPQPGLQAAAGPVLLGLDLPDRAADAAREALDLISEEQRLNSIHVKISYT